MSRPCAYVAGATGYVGREVVSSLRRLDLDTVAHVRPESARAGEWRARFEALGARIDLTPWEPAAMSATLAALAPTHVFALIGTTRKRARAEVVGGDPYQTIDYGLTALLLAAAREVSPPPRFIYLSSAGVGPGARSAYLKARWRLEQELTSSGLPHVIARPSFITGPDRDDSRPAERAAATVADRALAVVGAFGAELR
ncbi:MAG TPA: NAD(P)H-binding protein [Kofleriaceae bacterium]|nr:NAD(P)H-binding protein [Kofleriaceae bacterium]